MLLNDHTDNARIAIYFDQLSIMEYARRRTGADDCRDAIFTGNDSGMGQHPALIGDDGSGCCKQGCPRRFCKRGYQDIAWLLLTGLRQ